MRGLMAAASFVWRRLAVRRAPLLACPPACSGAFQPGFLATAGPVRLGMGGRCSRVESFVTQKFQGGLGGGEAGEEGGRGRCVRTGAGLGGDASHPARPLLSLWPGTGRGAPNPAPRAFPRLRGGPNWHREAKCPEYGNSFVVDLLPPLKYNWYRWA